MKKTPEEIYEFAQRAQAYLAKTKNANTKFNYALNKVLKGAAKALQRYNNALEDIQIDCASVDEKSNIIVENGQYRFTREKQKERNARQQEAFATPVELSEHMATIIPNDLSFAEVEAFRGFVLPEDYELKTENAE